MPSLRKAKMTSEKYSLKIEKLCSKKYGLFNIVRSLIGVITQIEVKLQLPKQVCKLTVHLEAHLACSRLITIILDAVLENQLDILDEMLRH